MLRDFCTHTLRKMAPLAIVLACVFAAIPLDSQNSRGNSSNSASAVMHIRVNVVPMVMTPVSQQNAQLQSGVTYNIPPVQPQLSVTQQLRPLTARDNIGSSGIGPSGQAWLRTTTVVAE